MNQLLLVLILASSASSELVHQLKIRAAMADIVSNRTRSYGSKLNDVAIVSLAADATNLFVDQRLDAIDNKTITNVTTHSYTDAEITGTLSVLEPLFQSERLTPEAKKKLVVTCLQFIDDEIRKLARKKSASTHKPQSPTPEPGPTKKPDRKESPTLWETIFSFGAVLTTAISAVIGFLGYHGVRYFQS